MKISILLLFTHLQNTNESIDVIFSIKSSKNSLYIFERKH